MEEDESWSPAEQLRPLQQPVKQLTLEQLEFADHDEFMDVMIVDGTIQPNDTIIIRNLNSDGTTAGVCCCRINLIPVFALDNEYHLDIADINVKLQENGSLSFHPRFHWLPNIVALIAICLFGNWVLLLHFKSFAFLFFLKRGDSKAEYFGLASWLIGMLLFYMFRYCLHECAERRYTKCISKLTELLRVLNASERYKQAGITFHHQYDATSDKTRQCHASYPNIIVTLPTVVNAS